jgi:hypothetical protein
MTSLSEIEAESEIVQYDVEKDKRRRYDDLELGKFYIIYKKGVYYTGRLMFHYRFCHDQKDILTFDHLTPNPGKYFNGFNGYDTYYEL